MEPGAYQNFVSHIGILPPRIPVEEAPGDDEMSEEAPTPLNLNANWTVYSSNILRGDLSGRRQGPLIATDWTRDSQEKAKEKEKEPTPWMSSTEPQPFMWDMPEDEITPRPTDHASNYPHPDLSLPHPSLTLDFRMSVTLNPKISVGPTPFGHRNWISFTGGSWSGSWGSGIVLPGGQDSQLVQPNGTAHLDTNYLLQTHDNPPAHIAIKTSGWRTGSPEVLAMLNDPAQADKVDPNSYKFRIFIEMETGDQRYSEKLNCGMWVGSGMRKGAEVIYDAYRLS